MAKKQRPSLLDSLADETGAGAATPNNPVVEFAPQQLQPKKAVKPKSDVVKSTIYLPPQVHRKLREMAFAKDCKVHDLILEGISKVLVENGYPTVELLKEK